jgi:hypothetical protein
MKKFTKWLYLVMVPALLIVIDICIYMKGQGSVFLEDTTLGIGAILMHTAVLMSMVAAYKLDGDMGIKYKRLNIEFEPMPVMGFAIGYDNGFILVIPFVAIRIALKKKKVKTTATVI